MAAGEERKRPLRVTLIGILSIAIGIIGLFPALGFFGLGDLIEITGLTFQSGPFALTAFGVAIANFILGLGCLYGWRPVWLYLVIVSIVNLAITTVALFSTDLGHWEALLVDAVWFALAVLVLLSMLTKRTRTWFHVDKRLLYWLR